MITDALKPSAATVFGPDAARTVWRHEGTPMPLEMRIRHDKVDSKPGGELSPDHIRLVLRSSSMSAETVRSLLEAVAGIEGERPADIVSLGGRYISVPLLEPDTIKPHKLSWNVTAELRLVHEDRDHVYFKLRNAKRTRRVPRVELTTTEAWRLVQTLASVRQWQDDLERLFKDIATKYRVTLLHPPRQ